MPYFCTSSVYLRFSRLKNLIDSCFVCSCVSDSCQFVCCILFRNPFYLSVENSLKLYQKGTNAYIVSLVQVSMALKQKCKLLLTFFPCNLVCVHAEQRKKYDTT